MSDHEYKVAAVNKFERQIVSVWTDEYMFKEVELMRDIYVKSTAEIHEGDTIVLKEEPLVVKLALAEILKITRRMH